jgi:Ni/Co efflux regulator RcnB
LPQVFLLPVYFYPDWAVIGLDPPPPDCAWVRYGPDLLLANIATGEVIDTIYDAFD